MSGAIIITTPQDIALADVQNPNTSTESGHIRRDVKVTVEEVPLGAATNIF